MFKSAKGKNVSARGSIFISKKRLMFGLNFYCVYLKDFKKSEWVSEREREKKKFFKRIHKSKFNMT